MKILLIQAKQKKEDRFIIHPPYGLLYLASVLRNNNMGVKIYDMNIQECDSYNKYFEQIAQIINRWGPDIIGIGGMVSSFKCSKETAHYLKEKYARIPLVAGGLLISASPESVMRHTEFDVGCIGEAEEIAIDLFRGIYENKNLEKIEGLVLRRNSRIVITKGQYFSGERRRRRRQNLDWIPLPSYDLIDLKKYLVHQSFCLDSLKRYLKKRGFGRNAIRHISPYAMPIFAGRGCPFNCSFCFSTMDKHPIKHSVAYVIRHIEYLEDNYGINHFQFLDENFNIDREWVIEFCNKIITKGNRYYFTTGNRNRVGFFDRQMLELMREANFYDISVGVESLDDNILKETNRATTSERILDTLRMIKQVGIEQEHIRCLFGFPSDTKRTILNSIRKGNGLGYKTMFALVIPLPGTELYRYCLQKKIIKDEIGYLQELYDTDGYRNMTSFFRRLSDVIRTIRITNRRSELDYCLKNKQYFRYIKALVFIILTYCEGAFEKFLRLTGLKKIKIH
jgi:radical SAM superfamily enzyme YgiQ (UPF0313 family)